MLFINNVTSSFPLAKNHVFTEVPLNIFGNNRLTFVSDTGKLVNGLLARLVFSFLVNSNELMMLAPNRSTWEPSG